MTFTRTPLALSVLLCVGLASADDPLPSGAVRRFGDSHLRLTNRIQPTLSPDGKLIAWMVGPRTVRFTEVASGKTVKDIPVPADIKVDREFHFADTTGARLLFNDLEHALLLDTATGKVVHTFKDHGFSLGHWVLSHDGSTAAHMPSHSRSPVRFWDLKTGKPLGEYKVEFSTEVDVSADGSTAVVSVDGFKKAEGGPKPDKFLEVIEMKTGKVLRRIQTDVHQRTPVVSADGKLVATNPTSGGRTEVRDTTTGKVVAEFAETRLGYTGHRRPYRFSNDSTRLAMYFLNGSSVLWDLGKKAVVAESKREGTQVLDMAVTAKNEAVLLGVHIQAVLTWPLDGTPAAAIDGTVGNVTAVRFTPDGKHLLTYATDLRVRKWEVATGKSAGVVYAEEYGPYEKPIGFTYMFSGSFSPDAKHLVKVSLAKKTEVVDTTAGKVVAELKAASEFNPTWDLVTFSADGQKVFAAGDYYNREMNNNTAVGCAWAIPDGKRLADQRWNNKKLDECVALTEEAFKKKYPDEWPKAGRRRLSVTALPNESEFSRTGLRVVVLDEGAAKPVLEFDSRAMYVNAVALSPDGTQLAVGWDDTTALLFDLPPLKK